MDDSIRNYHFKNLFETWLSDNQEQEDIALREIIANEVVREGYKVKALLMVHKKIERIGKVWCMRLDFESQVITFPASAPQIKKHSNELFIEYGTDLLTIEYQTKEEKKVIFKVVEPNDVLYQDIEAVAKQLYISLLEEDDLNEIYKTTLCKTILILIAKILDREESKEAQKYLSRREQFLKLLNLLVSKLTEQFTVADLSKELNLSVQYLNRLCNSFFDMTVGKYTMIRRLERSRVLLELTSDYVKTVSSKCGFRDSDYFIKNFHELYGITPNKYRQSITRKDLSVEEKIKLHSTNELVSLEPIEHEDDYISAIEANKQYYFVIANLLEEELLCSWVDVYGNIIDKNPLEANQRCACGSSKDQCWIIYDVEGNVVSAFKTIDKSSIAMVTAKTDKRKK